MKTKPVVLITNDDGISAPGIFHLWNAVKDHCDTYIVAPHSEKSGSGLATTMGKPLWIMPHKWHDQITPAWCVNGTPADCVKLGLSVILNDAQPDLILSGINKGSNAGRNVLYSGTIGGTIEGALRGIPGIAFSCENYQNTVYDPTEKYIFPIIKYFIENQPPHGTIINVTFPHNCHEIIAGIKLASQGKTYHMEQPDKRTNPSGYKYYWLGSKESTHDEDAASDIALLKQNYITAVPIHISQLTDHKMLQDHSSTFERIFEELNTETT